MVYGPSGAGTNGFRRAGSIVWTHSSTQEKTRVDSLALSSLELYFAIAVARKVVTGRLERLRASISRVGREVAHSKAKKEILSEIEKKRICPNRFERCCRVSGMPHARSARP